jgi:hypothetical protein
MFSSHYAVFWEAFAALAQGSASILGLVALIYSVHAFRKSLKTLHYSELDRMYFDLLRLAVEKPHLRDPHADRTPRQQQEYDSYAFMVWNFLETIHDRCESDRNLRGTWYPAMDAEDRLHREWFDRPENRHKFKEAFYAFVRGERFREHHARTAREGVQGARHPLG